MSITSAREEIAALLGIAYPNGVAVRICYEVAKRHGHTQEQVLSGIAQLMGDDLIRCQIGPVVKYFATEKLIAIRDKEVAEAVK